MVYPTFSWKTRAQELDRLQTGAHDEVFDALVIGGGIVGTSVARELQIRGINSLVVDKGDFAGGTSSKSSKLIHGGLRYLEMMDFGLVFESLSERHWLLQTHPHLVQPLEFNMPIYTGKHKPPAARNSMLLSMGLWLYDALSLFRTPFFHGRHSLEETRKLFPKVKSDGLKGTFFYADAMMFDDEVVLETVLDAVRRGAKALNYVKAVRVPERGADGLYTVELEDTLPEHLGSGKSGKPIAVKAKEVIVCVGPWTERINNTVAKGSNKKMKPSKGVHLVLPWDRFPIERCFVMFAPDGRIIFAIPRRDVGKGVETVIIGTTDSGAKEEALEDLRATRKDVDYLLGVLKTYFPEAKIGDDDVISTFAGVRPLIDSGAETEATTSREHEIWRNGAGVVFMAGGKYTTFRKIAAEIADFAFPKSKGREEESRSLLSDPKDYERRFSGKPVWGKFTDEWIRWKIEHHAPCTLEDLVFRRIPLWMVGKKLDEKMLDRVIEIAKPHFDWNSAELERQKERIRSEIQTSLAWK